MLQSNMLRVFVRLVLVATLVGTLFLTATETTRNTVHADPYCPMCDDMYETCVSNCPALGEAGHFICMRDCAVEQRECVFAICNCTIYYPFDCPPK
jgi:hypothetical protein